MDLRDLKTIVLSLASLGVGAFIALAIVSERVNNIRAGDGRSQACLSQRLELRHR